MTTAVPSTAPDIDLDAIIGQIDSQGYCIIENAIPAAEAARARQILMDLVEEEATPENRQARTQRVGEIAVKHQIFRDLLCNPLVLAVWQRYVGEDIFCSSWSANIAYPDFARYGWHVDYPYWSIKPPWPLDFIAGQTIWMLDDFTVENGATGVVPGSHRFGQPPEQPTDVWRDDGVVLEGKAGSIVLGHGAWYHTARPNTTDQHRCCLLGMYLKPFVIPQEDMRGQLAKIKDPSEMVQQLMAGKQHQPHSVGG
jgi:ectoine hydroxylase-related dioxygenase (phytanoyl-CoA dioxygenase family)